VPIFNRIGPKDLGVNHVVDSSFSFDEQPLARHYGIPGAGGEGMQSVSPAAGNIIAAASSRQGSVLKVTANGTTPRRHSRRLVMERIMGKQVPPVPATCRRSKPDTRGAKSYATSWPASQHLFVCSVPCQDRPPGFALESFDVVGGWRGHYRAFKDVGKGYVQGPAVDPSTRRPTARLSRTSAVQKKILLADSDQLAVTLLAKLLTYGRRRHLLRRSRRAR